MGFSHKVTKLTNDNFVVNVPTSPKHNCHVKTLLEGQEIKNCVRERNLGIVLTIEYGFLSIDYLLLD